MPKLPLPVTRVLRDPFDPAAVRTFVRGPWPRVGGDGVIGPLACWNDEAVRAAYKPHIRVSVRVFACDGLFGLARELQMPIYKLSVTTDVSEKCDTRLAQLNTDCYAATWRDGQDWKKEPGFSRWMLVPRPSIADLSPYSPVTVHDRGLEVLLPQGLSPDEFDKCLTAELGPARLDLWLKTTAGCNHVSALGLDPLRLRRFTSYNVGRRKLRRSRANELIVFKPRLQTSRLVGVIERMLREIVRPS